MGKFDNVVIATDLDGTFLGKGATLVQRNLDAVKYFTENGGHFTIATGRFPKHAAMAFPSVAEYVNIPAATCNGAYIYDFVSESTGDVMTIPYELMRELMEFVYANFSNAGLRISAEGHSFICTPGDLKCSYVANEFGKLGADEKLIIPMEELQEYVLYKAVIRDDPDNIDDVIAKVRENFGGRLYITQSGKTIIDIQIFGADKGKGIRKIVDKYLGEGMTLYTCGDYLNDIDFHAAADVAVCPSNARDEIKAISDLCLCSNDEGLIADLVEYIEQKIK